MSQVALIDELTDICVRQAEIIKAQAFIIEQVGAQALEDTETTARLQQLIGYTDNTESGV